MDSRRTVLIILLIVMSFMLFQQYQQWSNKDNYNVAGIEKHKATQQDNRQGSTSTYNKAEPDSSQKTGSMADYFSNSISNEENIENSPLIHIETDVLRVAIALNGGHIVEAELLKHAETLGEDPRYKILFENDDSLHFAESGLTSANQKIESAIQFPYSSTKEKYLLQGNKLVVPLHYVNEQGIEITKNFTFYPSSYAIEVTHEVQNNSDHVIDMAQYGRLTQTMTEKSRTMFMPTYRGAAFSSEKDKYKKYSFKDIKKSNLNQETDAGWVAMLEHYFVTAWIPNQSEHNLLKTNQNGEIAGISFIGPVTSIAAGQTKVFESTLYTGPKEQDDLAELAKYLDLTVDYGFLWWLAQPIHWLIAFLFGIFKNYGVAIICITIIIKALLYPLTKAQHISMAKMRNLAPRMKELKERYGDDRQKVSQAMMQIYKDEKVNPLGGCLPMFLQLPIFLALYWVLLESPEIRHANFALWITDLSSRDPYFVLPILMGASMFLMQRLQPTPVTDPMQQKIMQMMPLMFMVFFLFFPAGLVLYWLVSNLITILQMLWIYRQIDKKGIK